MVINEVTTALHAEYGKPFQLKFKTDITYAEHGRRMLRLLEVRNWLGKDSNYIDFCSNRMD